MSLKMSALYIYAFIELFLLGHDELLVFDPFFFLNRTAARLCGVIKLSLL